MMQCSVTDSLSLLNDIPLFSNFTQQFSMLRILQATTSRVFSIVNAAPDLATKVMLGD
jgi:hypothetical protein